jgi:hypothetical protein
MVDPFTDGQITHLLSLLSGGRKRPFAVEMLAGIQSSHPQLMVKRHPHADRDEVHVRMLDHFVRVGKSVGNSEMPGCFVCGFLAARADCRDLELRKRAQGRNVGIARPAVRILAPMMPTRIFSVVMIGPLHVLRQIWTLGTFEPRRHNVGT